MTAVTGADATAGAGELAHAYGVPVLLPDLSAENANRWPAFAAAALAAGVHAEFSLPLTVGPGGICTFDLCRDQPACLVTTTWRMLWWRRASLVMLYQQYAAGAPGPAPLPRLARTGS